MYYIIMEFKLYSLVKFTTGPKNVQNDNRGEKVTDLIPINYCSLCAHVHGYGLEKCKLCSRESNSVFALQGYPCGFFSCFPFMFSLLLFFAKSCRSSMLSV